MGALILGDIFEKHMDADADKWACFLEHRTPAEQELLTAAVSEEGAHRR
jgi:hypothetical protein